MDDTVSNKSDVFNNKYLQSHIMHIIDKMTNENIRAALNLTDTNVQQVHERQHKWLGHGLPMTENWIANNAYKYESVYVDVH